MVFMSLLFARWKGAKITTEHGMHVLCAYRVSLASLRPNQVESQLRIMAKCELGSEIYTDCIKALESVEEIGRLTLDDARDAGNTSESVVRRGRQASGRQGRGGRQSSQRPTSTQRQRPIPMPTSSWCPTLVPTSSQRHTPMPTSSRRHTPVHDHTIEEAS
ncbi:hypothetical protein CFP56_009085 [Quercus suber]|uniref:Uncharacterized protein n=1 Tax=Quercus suber TaxID=58331 RepID=A0AAW0L2Z5_QUESU